MIGSLIQNYKIYSVLGEGGMGIVYKAFDVKLERYVALKILNNQAVKQRQFVERFRREAKNQAKLTHPNIVPVYEFTEDNDVLGIAMEFVDGESLEQMITRKGRLELGEALGYLRQILIGISYAHKKGFIHRDIKPSNIIVNREGVAKIMDFGISKALNEIGLTKTGAKVGTIMYMSPEQVRAEEPTIQSDIYSIGITFYEMLSGKTPFDYQTEFEILEAHLKKIPQKLSLTRQDLPSEVDIILSKSLDKNIHKRYFNCEEFLEDVDKLIKLLTTAEKPKKEDKIKTKKKNLPWKSYLIGIVSFGLFILFGAIAYNVVSGVWDTKFNKKEIKDTDPKDMPGYNSNPNYNDNSVWRPLETNTVQNLNSVYFMDDSVGFACGDSGTVIKTTNGGSNWVKIEIPAYNRNVYDIKFTQQGKGLLVGENGLFLTCEYNGAPWSSKDSAKVFSDIGSLPKFFKIYTINNCIYLLAYNGCVFKSENNGDSWDKNFNSDYYYYGINFSDDQTGFIVTREGVIVKSTDKGDSWKNDIQFTKNYIKDIDFCSPNIGITVGGDEIHKTINGGEKWTDINCSLSTSLAKIKFLGNTSWIAIGGNGEVIRSEDNGDHWDKMVNPRITRLTSVQNIYKNVYVSGFGGVILKWTRM